MSARRAAAIEDRVMLAFDGERLPDWVSERLAAAPAAGMTIFRHFNVRTPGQVRELMDSFQRAGGERGAGTAVFSALGPLLVAADAEGGQLQALGDEVTPFAGNMALGAVDDEALTERVGAAIAREAQAMGVNVVYGPVLDLASEPANTALGVRSFGDDPTSVARHGAAMIRGLQGAGVAATVKHFPGLGAVREDTHYQLGSVADDRASLEAGALIPFRAAVAAGARLAMSAHIAVPALTGDPALPATMSTAVMDRLLRGELGFKGVSISDALDMRALAQGAEQGAQVEAAIRAGVDLLLCAPDRDAQARIEAALRSAVAGGRFDDGALDASAGRIAALRRWLAGGGPMPELEVVACPEHRALSRELAERAVTLVRRGASDGIPAMRPDARILAIMPTPTDLTPADTSSTIQPGLARALRTRFASVEAVVVGIAPSDGEIAALRGRAAGFDAIVVGTIDATRQPGQVELVEALASAGRPTVAVALRTPWDVATYPREVAAVCTYSILPDSLDALAAALAGEIPFAGRLPVVVPGVPGVPSIAGVPA